MEGAFATLCFPFRRGEGDAESEAVLSGLAFSGGFPRPEPGWRQRRHGKDRWPLRGGPSPDPLYAIRVEAGVRSEDDKLFHESLGKFLAPPNFSAEEMAIAMIRDS